MASRLNSTELSADVKMKLDEMLNQTGGRRRKSKKAVSKKSSKAASKKTSKKRHSHKGGKGINPAMQAGIDFRAFLAKDSGLKQGVPMVRLQSFLVEKAREKAPSMDYVSAIAAAKKIYLADKQAAIKKYNELSSKKLSRSSSKKSSKDKSKKASKKGSKDDSKKTSKKRRRHSKK